ncbi:MAG: aspartate/glutamate racemase family protein [Alphaproteobacteria bacterium]|nr:aspartate/glutamate racemase family protein [Alphaproteobacteria bacterium]
MKILLINPNVTEAVTEVMAAEARHWASPGTEIVPVTARFGASYIETRGEAAIAAHAVLDALAEHAAGHDAAIVSAFGDPGLAAAREVMHIPVVGIAEAAMLTAYTLGKRYAIVTMSARLATWYRECARDHGLDGRLVAIRALTGAIADIANAKEELGHAVVAECLLAVEEDGAEVVIMGGGPLAGLARDARDDIPVPVLDGVSCAVMLAESLVRLGPRAPERGSFAKPASKPFEGLSPALSALLDPDQ